MEPTPAKGIGVLSVVMTDIEEGEWHIDTKEDEESDIWCEVPESKTHKEEDLLEMLGNGRPDEDGVDMAYDCSDSCVVRNF